MGKASAEKAPLAYEEKRLVVYKWVAAIATYAIGQTFIIAIVTDAIAAFEYPPLESPAKYFAFGLMLVGLLAVYLLGIKKLFTFAQNASNDCDNNPDNVSDNRS